MPDHPEKDDDFASRCANLLTDGGREACRVVRAPKSREALDRHNDCTHLAVLSQYKLFGITAVQEIDHPVELAHCIAHRSQLIVGDLDLAQCVLLVALDVLAGLILGAAEDV